MSTPESAEAVTTTVTYHRERRTFGDSEWWRGKDSIQGYATLAEARAEPYDRYACETQVVAEITTVAVVVIDANED